MVRLLLLNGILVVSVLGLSICLVRTILRRRQVGLGALQERLSLGLLPDQGGTVWYQRWFSSQRLQGLYRGHEVILESKPQRSSGRLKYTEVLRFACPCVGAPAFEIHRVPPLSHCFQKLNPRFVLTGDASFDGVFVLKAESPLFVLELLNEPIRERLIRSFRDTRARGSIRFSEGEFSYVDTHTLWSSSKVDRLEAMVQRLYELSLAVKIFTQEN